MYIESRVLGQVALFVSQNKGMEALNCVNIKTIEHNNETKLLLTATDGYAMARAIAECSDLVDTEAGNKLMAGENICLSIDKTTITKLLAKTALRMAQVTDTTIIVPTKTAMTTHVCKFYDYQYPNLSGIMSKVLDYDSVHNEDRAAINFDISLNILALFNKALGDCVRITAGHLDANSSLPNLVIIRSTKYPLFLGICMPMLDKYFEHIDISDFDA